MKSSADKARIAVLISGRGSNMVSLVNACKAPDYPAEIICVLSDNASAGGLKTANDMGIYSKAVDRALFTCKTEHEAAMLAELKDHRPDFICLAGYMRVLSANFVEAYQGKILNIHPSLLPKYKGLNTHQRALEAGDTEHGCSVHFVTAGLDDGPTILQAKVSISPSENEKTLEAKTLAEEHKIYPKALALVAAGDVIFPKLN